MMKEEKAPFTGVGCICVRREGNKIKGEQCGDFKIKIPDLVGLSSNMEATCKSVDKIVLDTMLVGTDCSINLDAGTFKTDRMTVVGGGICPKK